MKNSLPLKFKKKIIIIDKITFFGLFLNIQYFNIQRVKLLIYLKSLLIKKKILRSSTIFVTKERLCCIHFLVKSSSVM